MKYTRKPCERCEGEGILVTCNCESPCDHELLCPDCRGLGEIPKPAEGLDFFSYFADEIYPSKKAALLAIEDDYNS